MKKMFVFALLGATMGWSLIIIEDAYLREVRDKICSTQYKNCDRCSLIADNDRGIYFYGIDHGRKFRILRMKGAQ